MRRNNHFHLRHYLLFHLVGAIIFLLDFSNIINLNSIQTRVLPTTAYAFQVNIDSSSTMRSSFSNMRSVPGRFTQTSTLSYSQYSYVRSHSLSRIRGRSSSALSLVPFEYDISSNSFSQRTSSHSQNVRPFYSHSNVRSLLPSSMRKGTSESFTRCFSVAPEMQSDVDDHLTKLKMIQMEKTIPLNEKEGKLTENNENRKLNGESIHKEIEIKSKVIPGGNWNMKNPLKWTKDFGRRSESVTKKLHELAQLKPGDEGYIPLDEFHASNPIPGVTIVRTKEQAEIVMKHLMDESKSANVMHACDTEVMSIDLKEEGPVGNGYVTCASIYSGPDFDYGLGDGKGTSLWIDNLDDSFGILQIFKPWFEDDRFLKVWHNYGFDRHVMWNEGINCLGFGGDTMHMARLQDTSRIMHSTPEFRGYSLEALTAEMHQRKRPMKEIFGVNRLRKDGSEGSIVDVPPVEILQRDPKFRANWIIYSAYDAESTWVIREKLEKKLKDMPWTSDRTHDLYEFYHRYLRDFGEVLTDMERRGIRVDAKDYLANVEIQARKDREEHLQTFLSWAASKIGPDGLAINVGSSTQLSTFLFGGAANSKTKEETERVRVFKVPREEISEEAILAYEERDKRLKQEAELSDNVDSEPVKDDFDHMKVDQLKALCKEYGLKVSGKKSELQGRLRGHFLASSEQSNNDDYTSMSIEDLQNACITRSLSDEGTKKQLIKILQDDDEYSKQLLASEVPKDEDGYKRISEALATHAMTDKNGVLSQIINEVNEKANAPSKFVDVTITSIGMEPNKFTAGGSPSCTADVLRDLAGDPFSDPPKYGRAYEFFHKGTEGHDACVALYSLTAIGSIDTMIANFLTSLQSLADEQSRVHCSLNINTETGRLSSRRPNLQNQPALEKDKYMIRKAFQASPGNKLIVADYGQLELRLLASMTNCVSMIEAFESGGDFHSRTALGMFDYIKKDIENGDVFLEWDYSKGEPTKPMLKDKYASERRKAKTLNFSIAYGKTAHGLSQDWGVSKKEAEEMLQAWYKSRPEVEKWQKKVKLYAKRHCITRTLMGRYRQLPGAQGTRKEMGHAERASINTPIQGGAADVAMMAMIKINKSELLKRLGWILLMQIHDEVILEGPEETAEEAFEEVIKCMQEPWGFGLKETSVPLLVDGSYVHDNWYDAK